MIVNSIEYLSQNLQHYLEPEHISEIQHAYHYAKKAHEGQKRHSGEPYITHPVAVADILASMHMDHQSLMAAILHDVLEDTRVSKDSLSKKFGQTVAELVDGVSKLTQMKFESRAQAQAANFQKMSLAMAKDIRVILIKLADRLHNMRTLTVLDPEKRRRIARETLDIYAPIANRLGMNDVRVEFEELGFTSLYPMRSSRIRAAVKQARGNRKTIVDNIKSAIEDCMAKEQLTGRVIGREKHSYSIYQKMRNQAKSFSEIMDVYAFRIIVNSVDACYRVLGVIHNLYKPVPGRFKDYIAIPKTNGYQSLHTTLFGMHGVPIEIQIRTEEMEAMANNGIAAHWLYKSNETASGSHARAREWVKGLLELQQRAGNSLEFIENVKIDLFPDEIYVFTPTGEIMELPKEATAVDFAYAVHTDIGNQCTACRIDRRIAPLSSKLQSGQTIEVITTPSAQPNPDWLNFAVTGKARSNIRHFLKQQRHSSLVTLGQRLLNNSLASANVDITQIPEKNIQQVLKDTDIDTLDDLLEDIGLGNRIAYAVASSLLPEEKNTETQPNSQTQQQAPLAIRGSEGLVVNFARCCHPLPGDPIIGHISAGRGVVIHLDTCNNISDIINDTEKCIAVSWHDETKGEFTVELNVEIENERGIVATLATAITNADANIDKISMEERDAKLSVIKLDLRVNDRVHLANVMRNMRKLKAVSKITRLKN